MNSQKPSASKVSASDIRAEITGFFSFAVSAMRKPVTTLKEKLQNYSTFKSAGIATLITALVSTLVTLITTIISAGMARTYDYRTGKAKTSWSFDNIGEINYFELIFRSLLVYIAVVAVIALVYFGISRIFKKTQTSYWRILTIVVTASIPVIAASLLSPVLTMIYIPLSLLVSIAGSVYAFYVFYEGVNAEVDVEGDKKVFFNLASTLALTVVAYIIIRIILEDVLSSAGVDLTEVLKMF